MDGHPDRGWCTAKNMNLEAFYLRQKDDQGVLFDETLTVDGLVAVVVWFPLLVPARIVQS